MENPSQMMSAYTYDSFHHLCTLRNCKPPTELTSHIDQVRHEYPYDLSIPLQYVTDPLAEVLIEFLDKNISHIRSISLSGEGAFQVTSGQSLASIIRAARRKLVRADIQGVQLGQDETRHILGTGSQCLGSLSLSICRIQKLEPLGYFPNLTHLHLDDNPAIQRLPSGCFARAPRLFSLSLCGSGIRNLWTTVAALKGATRLQQVRFQACFCSRSSSHLSTGACLCLVKLMEAQVASSTPIFCGTRLHGMPGHEAMLQAELMKSAGRESAAGSVEEWERSSVTAAFSDVLHGTSGLPQRHGGGEEGEIEEGGSPPAQPVWDIPSAPLRTSLVHSASSTSIAETEVYFRGASSMAEPRAGAGLGIEQEYAREDSDSGMEGVEENDMEEMEQEDEVVGFYGAPGSLAHLPFSTARHISPSTISTDLESRVDSTSEDNSSDVGVGRAAAGQDGARLRSSAACEMADRAELSGIKQGGGTHAEMAVSTLADHFWRQPSALCTERLYRAFLVAHLPGLRVLDNVPVDPEEVVKATEAVDEAFEPLANGARRPESLFDMVRARERGGHRHQRAHGLQKAGQQGLMLRNWHAKDALQENGGMEMESVTNLPAAACLDGQSGLKNAAGQAIHEHVGSERRGSVGLESQVRDAGQGSRLEAREHWSISGRTLGEPIAGSVDLEDATHLEVEAGATGFGTQSSGLSLSEGSVGADAHGECISPKSGRRGRQVSRLWQRRPSSGVGERRRMTSSCVAACKTPSCRTLTMPRPPRLQWDEMERSHHPRQFEYHPTLPHLMVVGTLYGHVVVLNHESPGSPQVVGQMASIGAPHSILGLCWLNTHPAKLIAGSDNGSIQLLDVNRMTPQGSGRHASSSSRSSASSVSSDSSTSSSWAHAHSSDSPSLLPSTSSGPSIYTYEDFEQLTSLHVNCTDDLFVASGYSNHVGLYDLRSGRRLRIFQDLHDNHINVLKFSHHSPSVFATSSFDRTVKLWDTRCATMNAGTPIYSAASDRGNVMVCFSPDDQFLLASAIDNEVRQLVAVDGRLHTRFDLPHTHSAQNYTRSYYMNGRDYVITGSCEEGVVRVCCARTGRRLRDVAVQGTEESRSSLYVQSLRGDPSRDFHFSVLAAFNAHNAKSEIIKVNLVDPADSDVTACSMPALARTSSGYGA